MEIKQINSFYLKGDTDLGNDEGEKRYQSLLTTHANVGDEEAVRLLILGIGQHEAEYWMTVDEAQRLGKWLAELKPRGPTNG